MGKLFTIILLLFASCVFAQGGITLHIGPSAQGQSSGPRWFNILDYGAVSDSTSGDNTSAIQAAINAAKVNGGVVYVPPGHYRSHKLIPYRNVKIKGDGIVASFIRAIGADTLFSLNNYDNAYAGGYLWDKANTILEDLCLEGNNTGLVGLAADELANFRIDRVMIRNFTGRAMQLTNCLIGEINGCYLDKNQYGIFSSATSGNATTLVTIRNSSFYRSSKFGIDWSGGGQLQISNCDFALNGASGDTATGGIYYHNNPWPGGLHISGGWAEENYGTVVNITNNVTTQASLTLYPTTTVHSIVGFQDLGMHFEFTTRNIYLKGDNQLLSIMGSSISGATKSIVSDGSNTINYLGTKLNNGTTMRGGAVINQVGL